MEHAGVDLWAPKSTFNRMARAAGCGFRPRFKDPVLWHARTRKRVGYFGAVRLRDGRFVFRAEMGKCNGASFFQFLRQLRQASRRTGRGVVIITDHAPYHPSRLHKPWRERQADHFALDFLPAYSPALNPSERMWKLTRRRCLHHRYFPNLDDTSAVETEFATGTTRNEALRRLCAIT